MSAGRRPTLCFALLLLVAAACDDERACRFGADCVSGLCRGGVCVEPEPLRDSGASRGDDAGAHTDFDAGTPDGEPPASDSGPRPDGGVTGADAAGTFDARPSNICVPNHDLSITREEVPLRAGLRASFRVAINTLVDTRGTMRADGTRSWSLAGALHGDHDVIEPTLDVAGQWFEARFPGADYATRLSDRQDLLGVFQLTPAAVLLLGVASPADGTFRTEIHYDPPVVVLPFPVTRGATWMTQSSVTGVGAGTPVRYTETYRSEVDASGELDTPYGLFPTVLRVKTALERAAGPAVVTVRTLSFVTECFGTIATLTSQDDEASAEFSEAVEVRRLAPLP